MLVRSIRLFAGEPSIGMIGTPKTRLSAVAITGLRYEAWNWASSSGSDAFHLSFTGVVMRVVFQEIAGSTVETPLAFDSNRLH